MGSRWGNYRENTVAGSDLVEIVSYQEFSIGGCMDAQGFVAALTPAVTDANARERFLADPKAVLAAAGLDLPEWFTVTAREGDAAELTITLPALRDPDADLSDMDLEQVAGGEFSNYSTPCWLCGL